MAKAKDVTPQVTPLGPRVLVEPLTAADKSEGGILIPDVAKDKPTRGTVRAVGVAKDGEPLPVRVGDEVLYPRYSGNQVEIGGVELVVLNADELLLRVGGPRE